MCGLITVTDFASVAEVIYVKVCIEVTEQHLNIMGLQIHSVAAIPADASRKYFIYVLDYGWEGPFTDVLARNFQNMAREAAASEAVVIKGIDPIHFANEVFSWHEINGEEGEAALPAILITSLHPSYFIEENNKNGSAKKLQDKLLLISLKKVCKSPDDVVDLIKSIFSDIRGESDLLSFSVVGDIRKTDKGRFADALMLEPNFGGLGVKLPQLFKWLFGQDK